MLGMLSGFNPGVQLAQNRASLALAAPAGTAPAGATAPAGDPGAAGTPGADGAAQAAAGAAGVAPPQPMKIILGSVIRGAVSGASMMFGINSFGAKIPFIGNIMTKVLHFLPFVSKTFPMGTVAALGLGAALGGIFGLLTGFRKSKKAAAAYLAAQQQAAQQQAAQNPVGDPLVVPPPIRAPKGTKTNPEMGSDFKAGHAKKSSSHGAAASGNTVRYHIKWGDTLWALSRRYHCSVSDIVRANPKITNPNLIYAGDYIRIPAK